MSDTNQAAKPLLRFPGGEGGHRSFFGGTKSKSRIVFVGIFIIGGMVGLILGGGLVAAAVALAGVGITLLVTQRTHNGTIAERHRGRARWKARKRLGTDSFVPYNVAAWDQIQSGLASTDKRVRREAEVAARRTRVNPAGSDGMGWLQYGSNMPGVAWHAPVGEQQYLSVAFSVSGQLRGMETASALTRAAEAWGRFLAHRASPSSLVRDVQTLTRVLPPDTAAQQAWVFERLDRNDTSGTAAEQQRSYSQVIDRASSNAMVQRHFVIVSWPITTAFTDAAAKYGPGRDGWRALMAEQIDAVASGLTEARMGQVRPLTARQTTALILHQQNPSMPMDLRSSKHVNPLSFGIASHDEFSAHVVDGGYDPTVLGPNDPITDAPAVEWWHRTAAIHGGDLSASGRSPLWTLDLLIGRELAFIRSVSFHLHLVPAAQAKALARQDVVRDAATQYARRAKGVIDDDENDANLSAAQRRRRDLAAGSHHHGVSWIGYVTITAPTREDLAQASRRLADVCGTGLGVERLDWLDSYQSAASGTTWPIGRGLRADSITLANKAMNALAGRSNKEALS